jgi:hypothetical protein
MADIGGRRWVRRFLEQMHVLDPAAPVATNALSLAYREGERNAGLRLQSEVADANLDAFLMMLKEARLERPASPDDDDGHDPAGYGPAGYGDGSGGYGPAGHEGG